MFSLSLLAFALAADPAPKKVEFTVGETKRETLIAVPEKPGKSIPLLFAFHGHGGTMNHASRTMNFQKHWPEAICVYMQGLNTPGKITDPEGKKPGWQTAAGDQDDRDLKFFDEVLKKIMADYPIDEKQIFCTGHSNGGAFTYTLWANRGDVFAAVAPSAGMSTTEMKNLKAKPCLHIAGEKDPLVKFAWQEATMKKVEKLNGCDEKGKEWAKEGKLVGSKYESKGGTPFISLIGPGGHEFPDEAPKLIVKFFQEQVKK